MIVSTIQILKSYIPSVNFKANNTVITSHLAAAQADIVEKVLGDDLQTALDTTTPSSDYATLMKLTQEAISVLAFYRAIPELDIQLTESGFGVQNNDMLQAASSDRINRLLGVMEKRCNSTMDAIVKYLMNTNSSVHATWIQTDQAKYITSGLIFTMADYMARIPNMVSADEKPTFWFDWYDSIEDLEESLYNECRDYIGEDYADELVEDLRDAHQFTLKERRVFGYIKDALVSFQYEHVVDGRENLCRARRIMNEYPDLFPTYRDSAAAEMFELDLGNGSVANFL